MAKVAFIWNYEVQPIHLQYWWDGLRAALDKLQTYHDVAIFTANTIDGVDAFKPDVILVWGGIDRPLCSTIQSYGVPAAFLYAGGPKDHPNLRNFAHIFYESDSDGEDFRALGYHCSKAFGTNTELFTIQEQPVLFDAIYPATFAAWKRHDLFARALSGKRALACGYWQEVEKECRDVCVANGVLVTKALHPEVLVGLYNASRFTVLTANAVGGCQRAVLESLACGTPVIVTTDNRKCHFGLPGLTVVPPDTGSIRTAMDKIGTPDRKEIRDAVSALYSETIYMQQLKDWIDEVTTRTP